MPAGRPSKYQQSYAEQAYKLCLLLGATDAELAGFFGVNELTINRWKAAHPEFCKSITRGKVIADANVAERMYNRALGYSHDAVKIFPGNAESGPVYAPYTEHYPPDTQAASLWLRNRQPGKWRDKLDHDHTHRHEIRDLSTADILRALAAFGVAGAQESAGEPSQLH